jgi:hypothetical protein
MSIEQWLNDDEWAKMKKQQNLLQCHITSNKFLIQSSGIKPRILW